MVKVNPKAKHHWLLGDRIGKGAQHIVFAKNDYVYKIRTKISENIFDFIEFVIIYLRKRNMISWQLPCKFVGLCYMKGHIYPVFKQRKAELINYDEFHEFLPTLHKLSIVNGRHIRDCRYPNFGKIDGKIYAIDVSLAPLSETDNFYD